MRSGLYEGMLWLKWGERSVCYIGMFFKSRYTRRALLSLEEFEAFVYSIDKSIVSSVARLSSFGTKVLYG